MWLLLGSLVVVFILYSLRSGPRKDRVPAGSIPSLPFLLVRVAYRALRRKQGVLKLPRSLVYIAGTAGDREDCTLRISPTDHKLSVYGVRIDKNHLARYRGLCGYPTSSGHVPVCYPELLFFPQILVLLTSQKFCLSPLGLIHLRQTVRQHEQLEEYINTDLETEASVSEYRELATGVEVDVTLKLYTDRRLCVWEGVLTLFSRQRGSKQSRKQHQPDQQYYSFNKDLSVPGNTGVKYAKLSGDWNPHHLYKWLSVPMGFKRPIAHGMWTLSKAMAELNRIDSVETAPLSIDCVFKRPLFMPGEAVIKMANPSSVRRGGCKVKVAEKSTDVPHLIATVKQY